jgi:hypothetical protein
MLPRMVLQAPGLSRRRSVVCDGSDSVREQETTFQVVAGLWPEFWARQFLYPVGFAILYFGVFL